MRGEGPLGAEEPVRKSVSDCNRLDAFRFDGFGDDTVLFLALVAAFLPLVGAAGTIPLALMQAPLKETESVDVAL